MEDETRSPHTEIKTTLVRSDEDEVIFSQQQSNKKPVINGFQTYTYAGSDSLTLQWYMDIRLGWFPWQKFSSLFFESTYGTMMEQGLGNLKQRTSSGN